MERQRQATLHAGDSGPGDSNNSDLDDTRPRLAGMLAAVDHALDSTRPIVAEEYLQQNRQQGAQ